MVSIILSHPQMGENIGAAARAMLNFGLTDLRLVAPRDGWPNERAITTSSGAFDYIQDVKVFESFGDAIADIHYVFATTSRTRDMVKPVYDPANAIKETQNRETQKQNVAIAFGAERTGLLNEEICQCQAILTFPANPDFASLNLGQAVLLMAYEYMKTQNESSNQPSLNTGGSPPAPQREIDNFLTRLEHDLDDKKFFRSEDLKPTMVRNIKNIFTRADITDQEVRTLHGILSALRGNKVQ
ncbi:MAG: RNA methyltransferase [Alphaproteobacteria bacterium]